MTSAPTASAYAHLAELRAAHAALLERMRSGQDRAGLIAAGHDFLRRARATGALLDDDDSRWIAQGLLDYWVATLYRLGEPVDPVSLSEFDPLQAPLLPDEICPYRGLDAFREEDQHLFFGRQRLIAQLIDQLAGDRLLVIVGPSGSGKSSLVRAGLLPRLRAGALPGSDGWQILPPIVPGSDPLAALSHVLPPGPLPERTTLLFVDQFEETFTLCTGDVVRNAFIERLVELVQDPAAQHRVILTMRSDFEQYVVRSEILQPLWEQSKHYIPPLTAPELREAIEQPAQQIGLKFESGLVEALLQDVLGEPAALPLLQFTLLTLWGKRDHNRLTMAAYREAGGGRLALARAADALYNSLIPEYQTTARRLLLRMVQPGEGLEVTSNRVRRADLYAVGEPAERVDQVLGRLIRANLVRQTVGERPGDEQVEVAHEALVRNWPLLVGWIEDARAALRQRRRLTTAAEEWQRRGRDPSGLLRGALLAEAAERTDLSAVEEEYVAASRAAEELERRREIEQVRQLAEAQERRADAEARRARDQARNSRALAWLAVILTAMLLIAAAATFAAVVARGAAAAAERSARDEAAAARTAETDARTQRQVAVEAQRRAEALANAGQALSELLDRRPQQALLYALAAASPPEARGQPAVQQTLYAVLDESMIRHELDQGADMRAAVWSGDGRRVAALDITGRVRIWDLDTGTATQELPTPPDTGETIALDWRPSADQLALGGVTGELRVVDLAGGAELHRLPGHDGRVRLIQWSPDGSRLLSAEAGGKILIWNTADYGPPLGLQDGDTQAELRTVAWSPDGRQIVTGGENQEARVWDAATGAELAVLRGHTSTLLALAWSPDGRYIASAAGDFTARIWDAATGAELAALRGHTNFVYSVAWSPDGRTLITGGDDSTVRFWDVADIAGPVERRQLYGLVGGVTAARFSADGSAILTVSREPLLRIWDTASGLERRALQEGFGRVFTVAWSPDGRTVAMVSGGDGVVRIRDAQSGAELHRFSVPSESIYSAAWSPDGSSLALGTLQGRVLVRSFAADDWTLDLQTDAGWLYSLAWSPDGGRIAGGAADGSVRIWDSRSGEQLWREDAGAADVLSVAWSPDGTRLLAGGGDRVAYVWDVASGEPLVKVVHRLLVYSVAWSPDGELAASASGDSTVRIWRADTGETVHLLQGHSGFVRSVAWSPDGTRLATGSDDQTLRIWDVASGQELGRIRGDLDTVYSAGWSPGGDEIVTGDESGAVRVWRATADALLLELERGACRIHDDETIGRTVPDWQGCARVRGP
jgi:WD40 repeat protein/energy-coupling factor transporter ATP-binding protein EcfA2